MASPTEEKTEQSKRFSDLSPNEFRREIADDGTVLLDTREQHEYDEAHIDRAELVPPSEVTARIDELAPDTGKRVVLYCRSGNRSARAAEELADLGYTNLAHLTGGILAWQEQGLPVVEAEGMTAEQRMRYSPHTLLPEVDVEVVEYRQRIGPENVLDVIRDYDVIVDGADNFPTRYLLNDASVRLRKPVVSASILAFDGQISTFVPYEGSCYRCLYPVPPPPEMAPSCGAAGVLGVMAGVMGLLQANEVTKLVAGIGEPLIGRLLLYES